MIRQWRVESWITRKQQSMQFSTTARRYVGGPLPWTKRELEITRQALKDGLLPEQIKELVRSEARPNPTVSAVISAAMGPGGHSRHARQGKVALVQLTPKDRRQWTEADLKTLRTWTEQKRNTVELAAILGRSIASVRYQKNKLAKVLFPWTQEELETLRMMSTAGASLTDICEALQRKVTAVCAMQEKLGLRPQRSRSEPRKWTQQNKHDLYRLWQEGKSDEVIARELPFQTSATAVEAKRRRMGLVFERNDRRQWTSEDRKTLQELFGLGWSDKDIAAKLKRPTYSIVSRRLSLGLLRATKSSSPWSDSDTEVFRKLVSSQVPFKDIIEQLSVPRSLKGLYNKAWSLGMKQRVINYAPWSVEDEDKLAHLWRSGMTDQEIQPQLDYQRTVNTIKHKRLKLGLVGSGGGSRRKKQAGSVEDKATTSTAS